MAKKKKHGKLRTKPPAADEEEGNGWAAIPGKRLDVDIADNDGTKAAVDSEDEFNIRKWTSRHYDDESDGDNERTTFQTAESDLFDPDPDAKTNKFDGGSKVEGADDFGMFVR